MLEKALESPLDCKEIKPVNPKENQSWIFIGRTDADWSTSPWPPDARNRLIGKDPDVGKDWRREENGTTEDEMIGWHHWLDAYESVQASGDGDGQGSLAYCSPWGHKESDTTEKLHLTNLSKYMHGCIFSCVRLLVTPCQATLHSSFPWVGCYFLLQGIFSNPRSNLTSPASLALAAHSLPLTHLRSPICSKRLD